MLVPDAALLRNLSLAIPLAVLVTVLVGATFRGRPPGPRILSGAFLGATCAWCGVLLAQVVVDGARPGLWSFAPGPTDVLGMPLETSLGWALTWGALPGLCGGRARWWVPGFAVLDVVVLPRAEPLVSLGAWWWVGELGLLSLVATPSVLLALATRERRWLGLRAALQAVTATALVLGVLPILVLARTGGSWSALIERGLVERSSLLIVAVLLGAPALAAVVELARVGGGTPFPWDPCDRVVVTGPYAYVANPMQLGATGTVAVLAVGTRSAGLGLAALGVLVFSVVLAERHERTTMTRRWPAYTEYRTHVRAWIPRWRPYVPVPATLWVDLDCAVCRATGEGVMARRPVGLRVRAAGEAGVRLTRLRWVLPREDAAEPVVDRGVAALARAFEQVSLPWAWCGWALRLPVIVRVVGAVVYACGLEPRAAGSPTGSGPVPARNDPRRWCDEQ